MSAVCATQSARVEQTASVGLSSPNRYYGRFYNEEYNVRGTLSIAVRGNRLSASLRGENGTAFLSLRRR